MFPFFLFLKTHKASRLVILTTETMCTRYGCKKRKCSCSDYLDFNRGWELNAKFAFKINC